MANLMRDYLVDLQADVIQVVKKYTRTMGAIDAHQYHPLTDALARLLDGIIALDSGAVDNDVLRESTLFAVNVMREYENEIEVRIVQQRERDRYELMLSTLSGWRKAGYIARDAEGLWDWTADGRKCAAA
jgi:hypothetical protein